jgi:glutamyl-tRNA reductase
MYDSFVFEDNCKISTPFWYLMQAQFKVLSISHERAPIEVRERFHLTVDQCRELSLQIREVLGLEEVLVLSTCNRTELYVVGEGDLQIPLAKLLCITRGMPFCEHSLQVMDWLDSSVDAARHLFEVSMGLRSQVVGDLQISNQVKQAYALSAELQLAGPFLHRLLHTIFHTNKRVQQETAYRDGAASVSYAAADLGRELLAVLAAPSVLVVGLGEMGLDAARQFVGGHVRLVVMNRTDAKAAAFAAENGIEWLPYARLSEVLGQFHLVVTAVAAESPIITAEQLDRAHFGPRFFIDLSVPRAIARSVDELPGTLVYDIDEIRARTDETLRMRLAAVPKVQAIIAEDMANFSEWSLELTISPTIQKLKDALEQIRSEEVARYLKNAESQHVELLEKVTKSMVNKIIKLPVLQLKAACKRGEQETLIDVLSDLFDLERNRDRAADTTH